MKRYRRNNHSHNQYTLQGLNYGGSKNQILSPKNQVRNAFTARSNHTGDLKKFIGGNKKVSGSNKNQYFIDSQIKIKKSPDLMRQKKKVETESRIKKKLALKERKHRKNKTCTKGQVQRAKTQAKGILRNKLKQSQMINQSKANNFEASNNSNQIQNNQKKRVKNKRTITSSINSASRKKLTHADIKMKDHHKGNANNTSRSNTLHFDLTIPLPQNKESGELEITQEEIENPGLRGPYISYRNSPQVSKRGSPKRSQVGKIQSKKYRKELGKMDVSNRRSPVKKFEQTGLTSGSNYASISSKNYKNGKTFDWNIIKDMTGKLIVQNR